MPEKEYIERDAAFKANCYFCSASKEDDSPCDEKCADFLKFAEIPAADVVPRKAYTELQAENCKLKNQVWSLKKKIKDMKSEASWDEDIRRGQVQGMW